VRHRFTFIVAALSLFGFAAAGSAQEAASRVAVDFSGGYAGFADESLIGHGTFGAGFVWRVTPRLSVGPEAVFMNGPKGDRDVFLTGKLVFDFLPSRLISPYVVADGGAMLHADRFVTGSYWSQEGAVSGGGGVRFNLAPNLSIAPEFRIGWEPHLRVGAVVTWRP
jgi:hypothetical protein